MKKILLILLCLMLTACSSSRRGMKEDDVMNEKAKCTAVECIEKVQNNTELENINKVLGFEGELVDKERNVYLWKTSDYTNVEVTYFDEGKSKIKINYDRDSLADKKVNFDNYQELEEKVNLGTGEISYEDFCDYVGGAKGTLIEKDYINTEYIWVAEDGSYLKGLFANDTGKCIFLNGIIN